MVYRYSNGHNKFLKEDENQFVYVAVCLHPTTFYKLLHRHVEIAAAEYLGNEQMNSFYLK